MLQVGVNSVIVGCNMSLEMYVSDFEKSSSEVVCGTVTYVEYFLVKMVLT